MKSQPEVGFGRGASYTATPKPTSDMVFILSDEFPKYDGEMLKGVAIPRTFACVRNMCG